MAVDNNKVVQWFINRKGKITYSMYGSRNGSDGTGDCSGCVVQAIRDSGGAPYAYLYNTDSMHQYLIDNGYKLIAENKEFNAQKGDVYIFGKKGQSGGAAGHTGVFTVGEPNSKEISCDYSTGGARGTAIQEFDFNSYWGNNGRPYFYIYRNTQTTNTPTSPQQRGWIAEKGTYTPNSNVNIREKANTSSKSLGILKGAQNAKYDAYTVDLNGYVWIRQPRANGTYGYLATGESKNGKRVTTWGKFY